MRLLKIPWTARLTNEKVLIRVDEKRTQLRTIAERRDGVVQDGSVNRLVRGTKREEKRPGQ